MHLRPPRVTAAASAELNAIGAAILRQL